MKFFKLPVAVFFFSFISTSLTAQTVSLGNKIWWDINDNGKRDSGEPVASGITINIYQDNNEDGIADAGFTSLTTTTDGSGNYLFSGLAAGKYFIKVDAGWSHYVSTVYGGHPDNDINNDNNGYIQDLSNYNIFTQAITLSPGTEPDGTGAINTNTNNTCDVGMWKGNGLGDMVWLDNNANGKQDTGEPGLANVTVNLRNASGALLETTTSDANGMYFFYDPSGRYGTTNYQIEFIAPGGYKLTGCNIGGDDDKDSDPVNGMITGINVPVGRWNHTFDAGFVLESNIVLPVKLYSFTANLNNNKVDLKWVTASEINASHFIVEKSTDGVNYNEAGVVFANGSSTDKTNYSLSDNVNTGQAGVFYYRLRSIDIDGKSEISEIRIIRISKQKENNISIVTYPNPVSNEIRITIPANWQNKKVVYELYNAAGKVAKRIETAGSSQTETMNVNSLLPGLYIVRVSVEGQTAQQKIIKQ
jgi:SdrD B-like domain/Secretion system C-terminal sorting domain